MTPEQPATDPALALRDALRQALGPGWFVHLFPDWLIAAHPVTDSIRDKREIELRVAWPAGKVRGVVRGMDGAVRYLEERSVGEAGAIVADVVKMGGRTEEVANVQR